MSAISVHLTPVFAIPLATCLYSSMLIARIPLRLSPNFSRGMDKPCFIDVDREEPDWLKAARRYFYRILKGLADDEIILDMAEFGLFTAEVREAIICDENSFPFIRASIGRAGFRRYAVPFKRQQRVAGETHYNLFGMIVFGVAGILSASTLFLRLPIYLLPFCCLPSRFY